MGTTPSSSNITGTLISIIYQIARIYNLKLPSAKSHANASKIALANYLYEQLLAVYSEHPNKKLIIFLDSIDQLNTSDYSLDWVLYSFPENIKMIYSTLPNHGNILNVFRMQKDLNENNYIPITSLDQSTAKIIISDWLQKGSRSLSNYQWQVIEIMFSKIKIYFLFT